MDAGPDWLASIAGTTAVFLVVPAVVLFLGSAPWSPFCCFGVEQAVQVAVSYFRRPVLKT